MNSCRSLVTFSKPIFLADDRSDMAEFYILPCYRNRGYGKVFAFQVFDSFPGPWQVRQISTAHSAIKFWRSVIQEYTQGNYTEDQVIDAHWGRVMRQCFESRKHVSRLK